METREYVEITVRPWHLVVGALAAVVLGVTAWLVLGATGGTIHGPARRLHPPVTTQGPTLPPTIQPTA